MSFNEGASLDTSQVRSGRRRGAMVGGGAGGVVLLLLALVFGLPMQQDGQSAFDLEQVLAAGSEAASVDVSHCQTGADANRDDVCRVVGTVNSVQGYWSDALPAATHRPYRHATTVLYAGATPSPCGTASNATGPFYCPSDEQVYIDASFFDALTSRFGADGGTLAQMYVVAHEYGHHVQQILGLLARAQDGTTGARSGGVRVELMADCLAGVWAHHAASTTDEHGVSLIEPLTGADIRSALSAAAAVGDDHIQRELGGGDVNPDTWTHGSSESRQRWFSAGYESGSIGSCDTFAADDL